MEPSHVSKTSLSPGPVLSVLLQCSFFEDRPTRAILRSFAESEGESGPSVIVGDIELESTPTLRGGQEGTLHIMSQGRKCMKCVCLGLIEESSVILKRLLFQRQIPLSCEKAQCTDHIKEMFQKAQLYCSRPLAWAGSSFTPSSMALPLIGDFGGVRSEVALSNRCQLSVKFTLPLG